MKEFMLLLIGLTIGGLSVWIIFQNNIIPKVRMEEKEYWINKSKSLHGVAIGTEAGKNIDSGFNNMAIGSQYIPGSEFKLYSSDGKYFTADTVNDPRYLKPKYTIEVRNKVGHSYTINGDQLYVGYEPQEGIVVYTLEDFNKLPLPQREHLTKTGWNEISTHANVNKSIKYHWPKNRTR